MRNTKYLFILLTILIALPLRAESLTLGDRDSYQVPVEVLRDGKGTLRFNDARDSKQFTVTKRTSYGFIKDVIWARFTVTIPEDNTTVWFLEIGYPLLNHITIYVPNKNGDYTQKKYGNKLPFDKRDINHHNFLIRLNMEPGTYTYYLRFQSESSMNIPLSIHSLKNVISEINIQKTIFGLFYGALLIILIYNLLLAISMKDLTYLTYASFIAALIFVSLQLNGYGFQYLWSNAMWMNDLVPFSLFLANFTLTLFSMKYIDHRILNKYYIYVLYTYLSTIFLFIILSFILPYHTMIMVGAGVYLPGIAMVCTIGIYMMIKGQRVAYFYALAFSFLFVGIIFTVANRFGLLSNNPLTLWGFQIGTVFSISLFSLGLADRVNTLKNSLEDMNVTLEHKVEDRTRDLSHAKTEIEAAMEELEAINERLTQTNHDLEDAQTIYRKDMNMAANLQLSLLPKRPPESALYETALSFIPKSGVSGDFYDFFVDGDGNLIGAGIFDVSGHGIAPGLLTLMAKSIISGTFFEMRSESLGSVVGRINNKLISEIKEIDNYLTGVILRFTGDKIEYINCAHPDIICKKIEANRTGKVLDKSGKRISGPFLGIDPQASHVEYSFQEITFKLNAGDSLLLFTDSLSETPGPGGDEYGETRIMKSLQNATGETAQDILNIVITDFFNFLGSKELHDDLTMIMIRKK